MRGGGKMREGMGRCPRCSRVPQPDDRFCGYCGYSLEDENTKGVSTHESLKLVDIQMNLGIILFKKGEYEKAIEKCEVILRTEPENTQAQQLLYEAKRALGQSAKGV
jgi:hypothetical protein